ncbi:MAG: hypothetical protein CMP91_00390 [Gammaproteobacteria bacterium]|nr:hypothetical protein [Gammaproteobacteria bacterium]|tara:strand:- start:78345 stop:79340 length:996 start_codon:yes stop_codon:yes gene_type:complete
MKRGALFIFKKLLKRLLNENLNYHKQGVLPNIAIFSSRRSGSTLLMQMIATNRKTKFIDQPFSLFSSDSYQLQWLPIFNDGQFIELNDEQEEMVLKYIHLINNGLLHINESWRFYHQDHSFISNRIVYKITDAHCLINWLFNYFKFQTIILTRHPISQSLSVLRNNWNNRAYGFLSNDFYSSNYLTKASYKAAQNIYNNGDDISKHVLGWCLENLPLIKEINNANYSFISYEELICESSSVISDLSDKYKLNNIYAMKKKLDHPSKSMKNLSNSKTIEMVRKKNSEFLSSNWKSHISNKKESELMDILKIFEIDLYVAGKYMPAIKYRISK